MDIKTIQHIAHLAKLRLNENELEAYAEQLSKILGYFNELSQVKTDNVKPLTTPTPMSFATRADVVQAGLSSEESLKNAPEKMGHLFKVPPVV